MTAPMPDPQAFIMGGGSKGASFETPGATVVGVITDPGQVRPQTDITTKEPTFWKDGSPKLQVVVQIQTSLRDDAEDDGMRSLYVKGGLAAPTIQKAIRDAVVQAGATRLDVGGTLQVTYTGNGPGKPGLTPPKYYQAIYTPPATGFLMTGEMAEPSYAQQATGQPASPNAPRPAQQAGAAAGPPALVPAYGNTPQYATQNPATVDQGVLGSLTPEQLALVRSLAGGQDAAPPF